MDADPRNVEEPPEKAVASIAAALDFLEREAKTAGLAELGTGGRALLDALPSRPRHPGHRHRNAP